MGDLEGAHGGESLDRSARRGCDEYRSGSEDVQKDLQAGELMQSVGQEPSLPRPRLDPGRATQEPGPVVSDPAGRSGRTRREHQVRRVRRDDDVI